MMSRLKPRLTFANVTASLALFVALGGTSYAVTALPRDSVGSAQLRRSAVSSTKVKDRSLAVRDLSAAARKSLRGATGPAGTPGAPGAAGISAVRYFAAVSSSGSFVRGNATNGGHAGSPGAYVVGFADSVSTCVYSATLGSTDAGVAQAGRVVVSDQSGKVGVQTYDVGGAAVDLPFHLIVVC